MSNVINLESTGLMRSTRMDNKTKKYDLFDELSLALIGACEVAKNPHIFLTIENQHIQENIRHFYGTLNCFSVVFASNQEQNE